MEPEGRIEERTQGVGDLSAERPGRPRLDLEPLLVLAGAVGAWLGREALPQVSSPGLLALSSAGLLLGQGLVRDLFILARTAGRPRSGRRPPDATGRRGCLCVESALGLALVLLGGGLSIGGAGPVVTLRPWGWPLVVLVTGILGWLLSDLVLDLGARRIRQERDHRNLLAW